MTKKDFELIAKAINDGRKLPIEIRETNKPYISHDDLLAEMFADRLMKVNPRFNRDKFLQACGVEVECKNKDKNGNACYDCESGQGYAICGDTI